MKAWPTKLLFLAIAPWAFAAHPEIGMLGLAHVTFQASNLPVSGVYYTGMLGCEEAFRLRESAGEVWSFKVNDDQFVRLLGVPAPASDNRLVEVALRLAAAAYADAGYEEIAAQAPATARFHLLHPSGP